MLQKSIFAIAFLFAVLTQSAAAQTSGLSCDAPQNDLVQMVCETPDLMKLDGELERVLRPAIDAAELSGPTFSWVKPDPRKFLTSVFPVCANAAVGAMQCMSNSYTGRIAHVLVASAAARDAASVADGPFDVSCSGFDHPISVVVFSTEVPIAVLDWSLSRSILRGATSGAGTSFEATMASAVIIDGEGRKGKDRIDLEGDTARVVLAGGPALDCSLN